MDIKTTTIIIRKRSDTIIYSILCFPKALSLLYILRRRSAFESLSIDRNDISGNILIHLDNLANYRSILRPIHHQYVRYVSSFIHHHGKMQQRTTWQSRLPLAPSWLSPVREVQAFLGA
jgi:hypothetical protein